MKNTLQRTLQIWKERSQTGRGKSGTQRLMSPHGFTLVEILVVIAILGTIAAFVASNIFTQKDKADVQATEIQIRQLQGVLKQFRLDCGFYPNSDQNLDALIEKPVAGRDCKNYDPDGYIENGEYPVDAWGNEFIYESDYKKYVIISLGKDGEEGGEDTDADIRSDELGSRKKRKTENEEEDEG